MSLEEAETREGLVAELAGVRGTFGDSDSIGEIIVQFTSTSSHCGTACLRGGGVGGCGCRCCTTQR